MGRTSPRSHCAGGLALSGRDPRSSIYKQCPGNGTPLLCVHETCSPLLSLSAFDLASVGFEQTVQQHSTSDWIIKTYVSQAGQLESSTIKPVYPCFLAPSSTQIPPAQPGSHTHQAHLQPPASWNVEPSADPWATSWDAAAPDDLKRFLFEVLLTPSQASKHQPCTQQPSQGLAMPGLPPDSSSKAASPVMKIAVQTQGVTKPSAACAPEQSASLQTLSACSANSDAATAIADFSHASNTQLPYDSRASSQTSTSRKRSQADSEQTDAQTAPQSSVVQQPMGRPAKKVRGSARSNSAKPLLTPSALAQAAEDGMVFAKFATFAYWPAQVK